MNKIPTAEEFFSKDNGLYIAYSVKNKEGKFRPVCSYQKAIDFAKLHVQAALESAYGNAEFITYHGVRMKYSEGFGDLDKESILNAYPLDNIK